MARNALRHYKQAPHPFKTLKDFIGFSAPLRATPTRRGFISTLGSYRSVSSPACRSASTHCRNSPLDRHTDGFEYGQSGLPIDLEVLVSSRRKPRGEEWSEAVDPYLPSDLRHGAGSIKGTHSDSMAVRSISTLPRVLAEAREQSKIDLLSYIGVYQKRWDAVTWLVRAMMEYHTGLKESDKQSKQLMNTLWPSDGRSLDELTYEPVDVQSPGESRISLQSVINSDRGDDEDVFLSWEHRCLGQIWQSLGTMILQAADRSPKDSQYSTIMIHVFQILGLLHQTNAFPNSTYNYTAPADPTVLQRPPTLYLLSKRIMSTLSDVEFDLQWKQEILKYQKMGYELDNAVVAPKVHEFGPELWLDLILWACVEGGWVVEAAWIIGQMCRRGASRETRWSVISWQEVCARKAPQLDWASILRLQIDRTRLNQVGGIGIATGTDSTVDMGTRTISREVVLAVMDGLLNTTHSSAIPNGRSVLTLQQSLSNCKILLEANQPTMGANSLNAAVLRMVENASIDGRSAPGVLQRVLDFRPKSANNRTPSESLISVQNAETDDTASFLGFLHRILYSFADEGNLQGSLTALAKILTIVDSKRHEQIEIFASQFRELYDDEDKGQRLVRNADMGPIGTLLPQIPVSTLTAFLDLITESKFYDLGRWLLQNEDIDGGILDPKSYSDANLQPALLRFATATADESLLTKVLAYIESPIPEPVLHALLRCQIALGKWGAVKEIFEYFRRTAGMSWKASDATAVARAILLLECGQSNLAKADQLVQARELLSEILHGKYNNPQDPSELPDLSQVKTASQLGRIFKTLPGSLKSIVSELPNDSRRAHTSVSITPNAFNILSETIVECNGPSVGKTAWERWCRRPGESPPKSQPSIRFVDGAIPFSKSPTPDSECEKVVTPTQYMLRNILRPILRIRQRPKATFQENNSQIILPTSEAEMSQNPSNNQIKDADPNSESSPRRPLTEEEQAVLDWGIEMYRKFGLSAKEINNEIPFAIPIKRPAAPTTPRDMVPLREGRDEDDAILAQ